MAKKILWSNEKESALIDLVQEKPALWNPLDTHYAKKTFKKTLYESIRIEMLRRWPEDEDHLTSEILRKKFCILRSYFQREDKRARLPSGSAALDIAPKWVHYHRLLFLRDTIYVGSSESNLDDSFATDGCSEPMISVEEADHFEAYEENCPESSAATPQKRVAESSNNSVGPPPKRRRQTNVGEDVLRMVSEVLKKKVKLRNLFPMRWDNLLFPL
ncbi:hypothetical protein HNY73_007061 [Argiope bruennichi]|uniref:MADF domain-containing protein n=1 Tax=Argiope bruennichi TaxID=94029 RepID=A0A8T0FCS8_ARGBR|nr:hypothetical protein HNY73_007061 [Argiope bruennichi]